MFKKVYQFKISLDDIKPLIWRRIQIPENYSFWDLHVAIQDAMSWTDSHLHHFYTYEKKPGNIKYIGIPDDEGFMEVLAGWEENIRDWFVLEKQEKMHYEYDFGDSWRHKVVLEKILPIEKGVNYPRCLGGKRACPIEDCGGSWGHKDIMRILKNGPRNEDEKELLEWAGNDYDPEYFNPDDIKFDDPKKRLKELKKYWS